MAKEEVRLKILNAVLALEISKGHLKWTIADVARRAKSSRPLVYYHFGKTKNEILKNCLDLIATDYYGLGEDRLGTLKQGQGFESLMKTRAMYLANPALVVFYQKWRAEPQSPIGKQFIEIERRYQAKIAQAYPNLSPTAVLTVHAIFHGLITAPFVSREAMKEGFNLCAKYIREFS